MKSFLGVLGIVLVASFFAPSQAEAGYVNGYYRSNGTYVEGYYRSDANGLKYDNYSWSSGDDYYNDSYYDSSYSSDWNTPSWQTQDDYWTGLDSYSSNNDYDGWFDNGYDNDYWGY
jgi:hypothetical protein